MTVAEIISSVLAFVSILLSAATFYRNFFKRFSGKAWPSTRLVLTHLDTIPCIGLACFFENAGAKPGKLDDLRLRVKHTETGAIYYFFPHLMRNDYSIFESYEEENWFPFSGIPLSDNKRVEKYLIFKPMNDSFSPEIGSYDAVLESRWYGNAEWISNSTHLPFSLTNEVAEHWNAPDTPALQVLSDGILENRKSFE
jgi:hypothetical protein